MTLTITITTEPAVSLPADVTEAAIQSLAVPILTERKLTGDWQLDCSFVGAETMRTLNQQAQGYDEPTDVLSFPIHFATNEADPTTVLPNVGPQLLGSLVVAIPVAERQAKERGTTLTVEIITLLEHGLHHLLGEDHDDTGQWLTRTPHTDFTQRTDVVHG